MSGTAITAGLSRKSPKDLDMAKPPVPSLVITRSGPTRTQRTVPLAVCIGTSGEVLMSNSTTSLGRGAAFGVTRVFRNYSALFFGASSKSTGVTEHSVTNSVIPTKKSQVFSTAADGQTEVDIKVLQGEREMAADNQMLGQFKLSGFPPAPKGVPQIEVTFDIDANGIVHVSARDKGTGKENDIRIKSSGGLSDAEIQKILREAEEHAEEDKRKKSLIEIKNKGESVVDECHKNLKEHKQFVDADGESKLKEAIQALEDKMSSSSDADEIRQAIDSLQEIQMKTFESAYKNSSKGPEDGSSGASGDQGSSQGSNPNAEDAEYKEVEDKK